MSTKTEEIAVLSEARGAFEYYTELLPSESVWRDPFRDLAERCGATVQIERMIERYQREQRLWPRDEMTVLTEAAQTLRSLADSLPEGVPWRKAFEDVGDILERKARGQVT